MDFLIVGLKQTFSNIPKQSSLGKLKGTKTMTVKFQYDADNKAATSKALNTRIDAIKSNTKNLQTEIHDCAVQALVWASMHGDVTSLTRLVYAVQNTAIRRDSLVSWVKAFAPIRWATTETKAGGKKEGFKLNAGRKPDMWKLEGAQKTPFWKREAEGASSGAALDFTKFLNRLDSLANQIQKAIDDGKIPQNDIQKVKELRSNVIALFNKEKTLATPVPVAEEKPAAKKVAKKVKADKAVAKPNEPKTEQGEAAPEVVEPIAANA